MRIIVPLLSGILVVVLVAGCPTPDSSAQNNAKELTAFRFPVAANPALGTDVAGIITGTNIALTVPHGTDVTALKASFITTGQHVAIAGVVQTGGTTANNFSTPLTYTVTAVDGSTQEYTVTVTIAQNSAKELTAFRFPVAANPALGTDVTGIITGTDIALTVPHGADVTALKASFTTTGERVAIADVVQTGGTTANNFSTPLTYTVTAADGSTQEYTVTVTIAQNSAKELTEFRFTDAANTALGTDVPGIITGKAIALTVPYGTVVAALVASFSHTGQQVAIAGVVQIGGTTVNNFSTPLIYTVTAADGSTQEYTVTVTIAQNSAKELTEFRFTDVANPALGTDVAGIITGTDIALTVPHGADVTALKASFTTTGERVAIAGVAQTGGTTANDFSTPLTYTVTAADGSAQEYTVTVTIATIAMEDTAFSQESKTPGDFAFMTLGKSFEKQKMIYVNSRASRTFPTGFLDDGKATLTHQFWMGETEVTNALFAAVYKWAYDHDKFSTTADSPNLLDTTTARYGGRELADLDNDNCRVKYDGSGTFSAELKYKENPVTNVSWYGTVMFCNWLTEMRDGNTDNVVYSGIDSDWLDTETIEETSKNGYRLPSSNEWEYTARYRGTDTVNTVSTYSNPSYTKGDSASGATTNHPLDTERVAVYKDFRDGTTWVFTGRSDAVAVKTKVPNALGIYDMSGNVEEWCFTRKISYRVYRGGSWKDIANSNLQVGNAKSTFPTYSGNYIGFRLCRTAD